MRYEANSIEDYITQIPDDRKEAFIRLYHTIKDNITEGFEETISYGMIAFSVPFSIYPSGYHANPKEPVPFIALTSQKNYIAFYHMALQMYPDILYWFQNEYPKHAKYKLDMGKGCIRFKKIDDIPYTLIAELCTKISLEDYLRRYESMINK